MVKYGLVLVLVTILCKITPREEGKRLRSLGQVDFPRGSLERYTVP
jgi:hypothetical protein